MLTVCKIRNTAKSQLDINMSLGEPDLVTAVTLSTGKCLNRCYSSTGHLTPQSEVKRHLTVETHRSWSMNLLLLSPKRIVSGSHCTSRRSRRGQFWERQIMIWSMCTRMLRRRNQPFAVPIDRILRAQTTRLPPVLSRQVQLINIHNCPQLACSQSRRL